MIEHSQAESSRFGLRIGRWRPDRVDERMDPTGFDVVIVRRPAEWSGRWSELTTYDGYVAVHADSLIYWEWVARTPVDGEAAAAVVDRPADDDRLPGLVRNVFAGYVNHYSANPLLDDEDALAGYAEWAVQTATRNAGYQALVDDTGEIEGIAVVDWAAATPDIRLAGMLPTHRGRGRYRHLLVGVMARTVHRGHERVRISTQVHNVAVQRVWASLEWKPLDTVDTTHLIREELLHLEPESGAVRVAPE